MARPKNKEEAILNGAFEVFSDKGYATASMQDIAVKSGLGKGTLYEYFSNKDDLFVRVIQYKTEIIFKKVTTAVELKTTALDKLDAIVESTQSYVSDSDFIFKFMIAGDFFGMCDSAKMHMQEILFGIRERVIQQYRGILEQGVQEGVFREVNLDFTPKAISELVGAYNHIVNLERCLSNGLTSEDASTDRKRLIDLILNGIGKHPQSVSVISEIMED